MFFVLGFDPASGAGNAQILYSEDPGELPSGQIACTEDQYQNYLSLRVVNDEVVTAADATLLAQAQADKLAAFATAYAAAITQPVNFTSKGGMAQVFQADEAAVGNLSKMLLAFQGGTVPSGFAWIAQDNAGVPFVYADMQGLAAAIGTQAYAAFARLQQRKAAVRAATTVAAVQGVVW